MSPLCLLPACFAVTDLDRFQKASGGGSEQFQDLRLTVRAMTSHVNEKFEFRVVDSDNVIQSRGFVMPLGGPDATIHAPLAIPRINGPYRLDFFADHNNSGGYDGLEPADHAWRIEPLADFPSTDGADGTITVVFDHNRSFTDLDEHPKGAKNPARDTGIDATCRFANMGGYVGKTLQVRIVDAGTRHMSGLYRLKVTDAVFEVKIPGIIDAGVDYDVEIYVDANGNGQYDNPAQGEQDRDHGFRVRTGSSREKGLELDFDPAQHNRAIDIGAP